MVDHDEQDCMLWIRSSETLRAKEKQYGPWLHAIPKRLQKPQMVVATNGDRGGRKTHGHEDCPGEAKDQAGKATVDRGIGFEKAHGKHMKGDVALSDPLTMHWTCQIPENMQVAAFEKKLSEIDEAFKGEVVLWRSHQVRKVCR